MNKKEKNKVQSSLYVYIGISFVIILVAVMIFTVVYFAIIRSYIIDANGTGNSIKELINDETSEKIISGLKSAMAYGFFVGVALIIVVINRIINPIRKITIATKKVAAGDFSVKVDAKRNDEIGRLSNNFNIMVKELNSIEYLRKDFISSVSHELKTPIASIQGFAKLLKDENLSRDEKDEYINIILEETSRLSNLSSNMLKLSKFENQEIITKKEKYKLDEQLRKAIIMLDSEINKKNIKIEMQAKPTIINEDKELLMEIWINLLNNAVKYTKENGKIEVNIEEKEDFIEVKIKDNGIGIPKEKQDRIFEKFFQVEKSHSADGGGLGLAIVKRIIELINGKIKVESEEGKGTIFIVDILKK